ncbi:MAG TPA: hypothetical protein VGY91_05960 [Chthoniobacterales bacterium]|nr:hypothetical protein [Chthoniobacterales bacterium]
MHPSVSTTYEEFRRPLKIRLSRFLATFGFSFVRNPKPVTDGRGDIDSDMIVACALLSVVPQKGTEGSNPSLTVVFKQFLARLEQLIKTAHNSLDAKIAET